MADRACLSRQGAKLVAIVAARCSSRRLPGKVLRPLHDRPMLAHTVERLLSVRRIDEVVIATSSDPSDDPVAQFAADRGVPCWRGALDDVLGRIREAAAAHDADAVIRISGDSPLIDPAIIRKAIALFLAGEAELVSNVFPRSFPKGQSVEILTRVALERLAIEAIDAADREHVTTYAYAHPGRFAIRNFLAERQRPELQLSVDTEADMALAAALIVAASPRPGFATVDELIDLVDDHAGANMSRIGVGIIGLGVGERHIDGFRRHPAARVVALCDIDPEVRARMGARYPDLEIVADAGALIDDARIGIVSVASYDDDHYAQVMHALGRGKHVFVEKPLCQRIGELRNIRRLLGERPELMISSNLVLRRSPRFIELRELIARGALGRLFSIEGDYLYGRLHKLTEGWRGRVTDYSVTLGGTIHLIDLILWLTGDSVREVVAVGNGLASEGSQFSGCDMVSALLRFDSGLIGKVSANFASVHPHFHRLAVYGTEATFENGQDSGLLWRSRDPASAPEELRSAYPGVDKGDLLPSFLDAIVGNGPAIVTTDDVLKTMAVGLAIDRSLKEGRAVQISEI